MALENYTGKIADMVVTNPTPTDPKSQGDDHLRGIKKTIVDDAVRVSGSPLQQLGASATASQNHFWDGSVPNQLSLKRGTPAAPGTTILRTVNGKVTALPDARAWVFTPLTDGQTYTNDTEMPMSVSLKLTSNVNTLITGNIVVSGVSIAQCSFPAITGAQTLTTLYAVIPVGAQFSVNWTGAVNAEPYLYKV